MENGLRLWFSLLITIGQLQARMITIFIYLIQKLIQQIKNLFLKDIVHLLLNWIGPQTANGSDLFVEHMNSFSLMSQGKPESQVVLQQLQVQTGLIKLVLSDGVSKEYILKVQMVLISTRFVCQETRNLLLQVMIMDFYVYIEIHACLEARLECTEDIQSM